MNSTPPRFAEQCREAGDALLSTPPSSSKEAPDFAFEWGPCWRQTVELTVEDFAAEVGFFRNVLGCEVNALGEDYAMFTSPDQGFFLSLRPVGEGRTATPASAVRLGFMVKSVKKTARLLAQRGVKFEESPAPLEEGGSLLRAVFRTPSQLACELWGTA